MANGQVYGKRPSPPSSRIHAMPATIRKPSGQVFLHYASPFEWNALLAYFAARATPGVEAVHDQRYWRTVRVNHRIGLIVVAHDASRGGLRVWHSASLSPVRAQLRALLRRLFDLDTDPR